MLANLLNQQPRESRRGFDFKCTWWKTISLMVMYWYGVMILSNPYARSVLNKTTSIYQSDNCRAAFWRCSVNQIGISYYHISDSALHFLITSWLEWAPLQLSQSFTFSIGHHHENLDEASIPNAHAHLINGYVLNRVQSQLHRYFVVWYGAASNLHERIVTSLSSSAYPDGAVPNVLEHELQLHHQRQ